MQIYIISDEPDYENSEIRAIVTDAFYAKEVAEGIINFGYGNYDECICVQQWELLEKFKCFAKHGEWCYGYGRDRAEGKRWRRQLERGQEFVDCNFGDL